MGEINSCVQVRLPLSRFALTTIAAFILAMPMLASAQSAPMPAHDSSKMAPASSSSMGKSNMELRTSMDAMHEKMNSMPMSGNPDIDFATMMRAHHMGALDMAQAELDNGKDPVMRRAAKNIITAQKKEIAEFDRWLAKRQK